MPSRSTMRSVFAMVYTQIAPPAPIVTVTALAIVSPVLKFKFDTSGIDAVEVDDEIGLRDGVHADRAAGADRDRHRVGDRLPGAEVQVRHVGHRCRRGRR